MKKQKMRSWLTSGEAKRFAAVAPLRIAFDYPRASGFPRSSEESDLEILCPVIPPDTKPFFYQIVTDPLPLHADTGTPGGGTYYRTQAEPIPYKAAEPPELVALDRFIERVGAPWSPFSMNGEMHFPHGYEGPFHLLNEIQRLSYDVHISLRFLGVDYVMGSRAFGLLCASWGVDATTDLRNPMYEVFFNGIRLGPLIVDPSDGPPDVLRALVHSPLGRQVHPRAGELRNDPGLYISGDDTAEEFELGWEELDEVQLEEYENGDGAFPDEKDGGEDITIATFRRV